MSDFFGMCIVEQLGYFEHPSASEIRSDDPDPGHIRQALTYLGLDQASRETTLDQIDFG